MTVDQALGPIKQGQDQVYRSLDGSGPGWGKLDLARDYFIGKLPQSSVDGGAETPVVVTASGATTTLDASAGIYFVVNLQHDTTISFINVPADTNVHGYTIELTQDATGGRVPTFGAAFKWPSGVVPNWSTGVNRIDKAVFQTRDGGATFLGNLVGVNYS